MKNKIVKYCNVETVKKYYQSDKEKGNAKIAERYTNAKKKTKNSKDN